MKMSRIFLWLLAAAILLNGLLAAPQLISDAKSRARAVKRFVQILDTPALEISLSTGTDSPYAKICYVATSAEEISSIISSLHAYQRLYFGGRGSVKVPFVLAIDFVDGSVGHFVFTGWADEQARAHLDRIEYLAPNEDPSEVIDKVGLRVPEIGVWAARVMDQNNCR